MEPIPVAWERLQEYMPSPWDGELAASGAFLSLTTNGATALIKNMVANQG
jgi:hypothetical protein